MIGAFGNLVPGAHQRLELRERRAHFPGHGSLLGFFSDDLGRQLLEIAQHRCRELENVDLALELCLEPFERDSVLRMEVGSTVDVYRSGSMVEDPPKVDGERIVRLLVEAEVVDGGGLLPARIVIIPRATTTTQAGTSPAP